MCVLDSEGNKRLHRNVRAKPDDFLKAIHGGKRKEDRLDSEKISRLLRGGTFPQSYVYPQEMRATRDLLRRRSFLMRRRSEFLAHVQLVNQQYNLDPFEKKLQYACNRDILDRLSKFLSLSLG